LGCSWTTADNGRTAIESLKHSLPDVVLMDLHMPEVDGLTATTKIRSGAAGAAARDIWIVALTAAAREEQQERTLAAGANDYPTKPVQLAALTAALQRFLQARRREVFRLGARDARFARASRARPWGELRFNQI